ncbi:MAG: hypothetical protein JWN48_1565 [Myxococcaceae bacterium]|nr:hypothetical protein [Myxococcaceae bacterium]
MRHVFSLPLRVSMRAYTPLLCGALLACSADDTDSPAAPPDAGVTQGQDGVVGRKDASAAGPQRPLDSGLTFDASASGAPASDGAQRTASEGGSPSSSCGACASDQACDPVGGKCVDKEQPFQLDCAHLPSDGVCQGGPREVLLASMSTGQIAMLDPQDGKYLGLFKRPSQRSRDRDHAFRQATQGPDQCIWSVTEDTRETLHAVQRWNTDGSLRDEIIPRGKYMRGERDRLSRSRALAFDAQHVYVASGDDDQPHVSRFKLDGSFEVELNQASALSLLLLGDGSLLTGGLHDVQRWPADGSAPTTVLSEKAEQLWYLGHGEIALSQLYDYDLYRVGIASGVASHVSAVEPESGATVYDVAQLGNGRWLYGANYVSDNDDDAGELLSLDPSQGGLKNATQLYHLGNRPRRNPGVFMHFGRACLPNEVVTPTPVITPAVPVAQCDQVPAGAALLSDNFDTGAFAGVGGARNYKGWSDATGASPQLELDTTEHVSGTRSLRISPKDDDVLVDGAHRAFAGGIKPSYIGYWAKLGADSRGWLYFQLTGSEAAHDGVYLTSSSVQTTTTKLNSTVPDHSWVRIQLRNIDWTKRTYDLYVNCERVESDVLFTPEAGEDLRALDVYIRYTGTDTVPAFLDDVVVSP